MNIIYREIKPDERDQLLELNKHLNTNDLPLPEEAEVEAVWQEILTDKKIHCVVADYEGKLVASCILVIIPNLTRGAKPYGLIENVVTHANYRKKGIGRNILQYALSIAWKHQCYKVMLLTGRKDEATLMFYENSGFVSGVKTGFIAYPG
ncbi:MAG TPA: GNAT family N-acetyltransferase [Anaerolineales bacterium]|nr:GNAT family N-acetyltransferase [Anaerolineales bacterium]